MRRTSEKDRPRVENTAARGLAAPWRLSHNESVLGWRARLPETGPSTIRTPVHDPILPPMFA